MKTFLIALASICLVACENDAASRSALENYGFTEIQLKGYQYWGCGEGDAYHTGFTAKNVQGKQVTGVVCCGGWGKACTVRF